MRESQLTTNILKSLRARGGFWIKIHGNASQTTGIPDILGCYRGRFVAIEVKLPDRVNVSQRQRLMLDRVIRSGGFSNVVTTTSAALQFLDYIDSELDDDDFDPNSYIAER